MPEVNESDNLQTSQHHVSNSAISFIFRLLGGLILLESAFLLVQLLALSPNLGIYQEIALRLFWVAVAIKWLAEIALCLLITAHWAGTNYYINNDQLIRYRGIRRRDENVYDLSILKTVELHQGWWGRMLNYGDLRLVFSSSGYSETLLISAIYNPKKYERVLRNYLVDKPSSIANEEFAPRPSPS